MRKVNYYVLAGVLGVMTACGGSSNETANNDEGQVEMKTLKVDSKESSLKWKGMKTEEYFHVGEVEIEGGKAEFVDGNLAKGTFTIDLTEIEVTDETLPDDKKAMLAGHLKSADFFNTEENKKAVVEAGALENGKLPITIKLMGQEIKEVIPVQLTMTDGMAKLTGEFDIDFSKLNRPGFQVQKPGEENVKPVVHYNLNVVLK